MRRETMETGLRRARDARVALAFLLVLSMAANLVLALGLAGREAVTVLVPAVTGPAWEVGAGRAGRAGQRYLEDMARTAAVTLLSLTPENAEHVREAAARLSHPSARGAISAWVAAEARRMAGRDLAAAFYPKRIEADPEGLTVDVEGELATWIGREESAREDKRYRLTFRLDAGTAGAGALRGDGADDDVQEPDRRTVNCRLPRRPCRCRAHGGVCRVRRPARAGRGHAGAGGGGPRRA